MSVVILVQHGQTILLEGLIKHDTETFEIVATMASDFRSSLHLKDTQTLHDFMVTKFAAFASISNNCAWSPPCSDDFVIGFILRYDDICVNNVSDLAEHIFCLSINILRSLLLSLDCFIESLRLGLLLRNISFLICFLLSGYCPGDVSFLFSQIVQRVLRCD